MKTLPYGIVGVDGASGHGRPLPKGKPGREAHAVRQAIPSQGARFTDEQWALVSSLLPPQRGSIGRPPNDHRAVLGGILWVARTGSLWREMPEEYGDFTTAYKRWRLRDG